MAAGRIYVGVGGWSFAPWRGVFYPGEVSRAHELDYASRHLTSIEINATFYRTQTRETFLKWRDETPENFVFSVKAPRFAVTRRNADEAQASIARFFDSGVAALGHKLGPVLWQFPPTRKYAPEFFDAFLSALPKECEGRPMRHAIEVRHETFETTDFVALARAHHVAIVVEGDSDFPMIADLTAPFVYARIMGTDASRKQGYDKMDLDRWAARAKLWAEGGAPDDLPRLCANTPKRNVRDVFLYVIRGAKIRNPAAAMALIERLQK
ncbi:DUF72 domain-containing protein [Methylocystis parvus]|uniref:DUF72 domain-containing protein n=1 Tax=Methylocystis parvus TaxID=134 RepID=A0A6B8MBB8_9HYPH|nr:DUF72 domain-containing protein [Methylocystis parvus]QGM99725.1 DUF72 domain-containing protein [Methylocystis parvus]WBK02021.1 DUF72 domain-containing protein [Methylocystis parvus OBBP]